MLQYFKPSPLAYSCFPEHVAPPKKPPRPGAPGHLGNLASLSLVDSYNEGVKVQMHKIPVL